MENTIFLSLQIGELEDLFRKIIREELSNKTTSTEARIPDDDVLLKIDQVATMLKVSEVTIHKWKSMEIIPYHKLNRRLYFKKSEVIDSLRNIDFKQKR
jgi:hypothetical protein